MIERCKARCPLLSTAEVFVLVGCRLVPDCGRKFATNGVKLSALIPWSPLTQRRGDGSQLGSGSEVPTLEPDGRPRRVEAPVAAALAVSCRENQNCAGTG